MTSEGSGAPFATLTHARLRAAQGDFAGAARILRIILAAQPDHDEAREVLESVEHRVVVTYREPLADAEAAARPASSADLKERFREALEVTPRVASAVQLTQWLERVRRNRGERRVR